MAGPRVDSKSAADEFAAFGHAFDTKVTPAAGSLRVESDAVILHKCAQATVDQRDRQLGCGERIGPKRSVCRTISGTGDFDARVAYPRSGSQRTTSAGFLFSHDGQLAP